MKSECLWNLREAEVKGKAGRGDWGLPRLDNTSWEGSCSTAHDAKPAAKASSPPSKNNGIVYNFCGFTWHRSLRKLDQANCKHKKSYFEHRLSWQCCINHRGKQNWLWRCLHIGKHLPTGDESSVIFVSHCEPGSDVNSWATARITIFPPKQCHLMKLVSLDHIKNQRFYFIF